MRICLVSQEYPPGRVGGIGTQTRVKAMSLAAEGHEVELLTAAQHPQPWLTTREDGGVTVHELQAPGTDFEVYRTETYWLGYSWAVLGALRSLPRSSPFDVIDFPDYGAEGFAFQLDRAEDDRTAVVVHLHGSLGMFCEKIGWPDPSEGLHRVGLFMEELSLDSADGLIAASDSIAELTAKRLSVAPGRIGVVQGAVDSEMFTPARERDRAAEDLRLLFVGSIAANKGVRTVLEAFIRLAPSYPSLSLTLAGAGDDDLGEELRAQAAQAGVGERFRVLGFVEHSDLPALYRSADLFAAPSQYEGGLGMVYLEAMASGLPVIASAAGGAAEAVSEQTGILLQRGDVIEAAGAIAALLDSPQLRRRMGEAGRVRVQELFTAERYAARVTAAYEQAIARRRDTAVVW